MQQSNQYFYNILIKRRLFLLNLLVKLKTQYFYDAFRFEFFLKVKININYLLLNRNDRLIVIMKGK